MISVRTTKTASGAIAVQTARYRNRKVVVLKHFGSAHNPDDVVKLRHIATRWIAEQTHQQQLFPPEKEKPTLPLVSLDKLSNLGFYYTFTYEVLSKLVCMFFLTNRTYQILLDLVVIRIIQPASKVEAFTLLQKLFGISYERRTYYRLIPALVTLKELIEHRVVAVAKEQFSFDFQIVFYDVTTLYCESFTEDGDAVDAEGNVIEKGLRKNGFSKDLKFNQPQIVIGLIVTNEGFPVAYDVFEGNTFEGDTFIPMIWQFKKRYTIETLTVVADAAMISFSNVKRLQEKQLSYIVGARLGNLTKDQLQTIHTSLIGETQDDQALGKKDGVSTRIATERGILVCDFSFKRYQKDKREMEKQIAKAKLLLDNNEGVKRAKFLKNTDKTTTQVLNTVLIEKTQKLLGDIHK